MTDQWVGPTSVSTGEPEPTNSTGARRQASLDVTRALALVGVVVLNYHGFLNSGDDGINRSLSERILDPFVGPLATRFAATFVVVAGMGVTLLTNRSRLAASADAILADRWRLARRGLLLYTGGLLLEWVWPGTILFFYGALFMAATLLFTLRLRWIATVGAVSALAGAAVAWFRFEHTHTGHNVMWLDPEVTSPRNLLFRTFIGYTHPLFPWLAFLCVGIMVGRFLPLATRVRRELLLGAASLLIGSYALNHFAARATEAEGGPVVKRLFAQRGAPTDRWQLLLSTRPFDRGLLYTIGTIGSSLIAFCLISMVVDRLATAPTIRMLQDGGQMTLTIYVCHALVFNVVVHWLHWVRPTGLDSALVLGLTFWISAIACGALWHRFLGMGPLERVYRGFGG